MSSSTATTDTGVACDRPCSQMHSRRRLPASHRPPPHWRPAQLFLRTILLVVAQWQRAPRILPVSSSRRRRLPDSRSARGRYSTHQVPIHSRCATCGGRAMLPRPADCVQPAARDGFSWIGYNCQNNSNNSSLPPRTTRNGGSGGDGGGSTGT